MKSLDKRSITVALAAVIVLIVASAVSISETAIAAKPAGVGAQVIKKYCIDYIYHPDGPGTGGTASSQECFDERAFCHQQVAHLKEDRAFEYTVTNDNCYKKITVTTPR